MSINTIINNAINIVVWPTLFGCVVIMFVYSGILFAIAAGDPSKVTSARKALTFAIIGLFVGIIAFSVKSILSDILT